MKRYLTTAAMALMIAVPATAQQHERDEMSHEGGAAALVGQFSDNQMAVHELLSGLTPEQWTFKEAEDRWSILEVLEHIIVAEQVTHGVVTGELTEIDATQEKREMAAGFEQQISANLSDRSQKFPAPAEFVPNGRWSTGEEAIAAFDETRGQMIYFLENAGFDLRTRGAENPIVGAVVDVSGWATIAAQHTMRHMQQIQEVKDAEGFPS